MGTALIVLLVLVGGIVLLALFAIGEYNGLVTLRNRYKNAFSQIDVQLKRRHDLIPNLVETAKGYIKHERETLEAVIAARNSAYSAGAQAAANPGDPQAMKALSGAESGLSGALGRLFAVAEAYPDLKANQNFQELQTALTALETEIQNARRYYNAVVRDFNTKIQSVPDVFVARMAGFKERDYFELADAAEGQVPKVQF
jgi:LemA protein